MIDSAESLTKVPFLIFLGNFIMEMACFEKVTTQRAAFSSEKESFIKDDDTMVYYSLNCGLQSLIS